LANKLFILIWFNFSWLKKSCNYCTNKWRCISL